MQSILTAHPSAPECPSALTLGWGCDSIGQDAHEELVQIDRSDGRSPRDLSPRTDGMFVLVGSTVATKRSACILMMSNAIDLILLVCTLYLCRVTCHVPPRLSTGRFV